jgi:hypothetical protein
MLRVPQEAGQFARETDHIGYEVTVTLPPLVEEDGIGRESTESTGVLEADVERGGNRGLAGTGEICCVGIHEDGLEGSGRAREEHPAVIWHVEHLMSINRDTVCQLDTFDSLSHELKFVVLSIENIGENSKGYGNTRTESVMSCISYQGGQWRCVEKRKEKGDSHSPPSMCIQAPYSSASALKRFISSMP